MSKARNSLLQAQLPVGATRFGKRTLPFHRAGRSAVKGAGKTSKTCIRVKGGRDGDGVNVAAS